MPDLSSELKASLDAFSRANKKMIATSENSYTDLTGWHARVNRVRDYTPEEIAQIIASGSLEAQQKLSRNYFYKDGYYKQIIIYYATLLKYAGLLTPNPTGGKSLTQSHLQKRYYKAVDYIERMKLPTFLTNCAQRALIDGSYYGVIAVADKNSFAVIDLPTGYCKSRFKDVYGNDIIEFNVQYFDTIPTEAARKAALATYPKIISKSYKEYHSGSSNPWVMIPGDIGVCFPFFDGRPLLLSVIPATIDYDEAVINNRERDAEEIKKIIVQQIPHLADGRLLFEPDEAAEIHAGTVGMMKGNKNVSVLTTYADVNAITSNGSIESIDKILDRSEKNIYSQAGVTGAIFSSTGASSIEASLDNDLALMMYMANKFADFISNIINSIYGTTELNFKYTIFPISYYNTDKYVDTAFKLASSGYSLLLPALAMGISQKDLGNIKDLENNVLKLDKKLIPLSSSYTQSGSSTDEGGRPEKEADEKSEKTIENEKSLDNN